MRISHSGVEYEFGNDGADKIFKSQNKYISNIVTKYKAAKDIEGLLVAMISLNFISNQYLKTIGEELCIDTIIKILKAKKVIEDESNT